MRPEHGMTRRELLAAGIGLAAGSAVSIQAAEPAGEPLRFGVITDVHQDIIPDGVERLSAFVDAMTRARVRFILQMGDFCIPKDRNRPFLDAWNKYPGPRLHVLGNHDMDEGVSQAQAAAFLGMPARHYTHDEGGVRFVVLDGNDAGGKVAGYKRYLAPDQLDWFRVQLLASDRPVVVVVHQPIDSPGGIENGDKVREAIAAARKEGRRVLAVLTGHYHQDYVHRNDEVPHVQINSASYHWMGDMYAHASLSPRAHERSKALASTCPYKDPLWAVVSVDPKAGVMTIDGRSTEWVGGSPWDVGATRETHDPEIVRPAITSRTIQLG